MWIAPINPEFYARGVVIGVVVMIILRFFVRWLSSVHEDGVMEIPEAVAKHIVDRYKDHPDLVPHCPKCDALSLDVRWRKRVWAAPDCIGTVKRDYNMLETHYEGSKKRRAICLQCGHNRHVIKRFKESSV